MSNKSQLKVVMGAMTFGYPGTDSVRVSDPKDVEAILDAFQKHGHVEVDTARTYTDGTSEAVLGDIGWQKRGLIVHTKLYPFQGIRHTPEGIREHLDASYKALKTDKLEVFYLHGPDRQIPWEVTLKAVDDLHKEGKFERLGISNYTSWEVAEIVTLCRLKGWIQPTIYQGVYNAIHRSAEPELFPCLRKFGIAFYEFNPLCGGFFTGRYKKDQVPEEGSRFDMSQGTLMSQSYRGRYWKDEYFQALDIIENETKKHGLTLPEVALRWINHHSMLKREHGDAILIGASSLKHVEENLVDLEKPALPESVVTALDQAWRVVKNVCPNYWH